VDNNICTEIISNDDSKLKTGAIIGIVFGCLGFLLLVAGTLYFLMAKFFKKNGGVNTIIPENNNRVEITEGKGVNNQEEDAKVPENENENKIEVHTNRRSIHNVKN